MSELSASAERALYDSDRPAWIAYVAPRMAAGLAGLADEVIGPTWAALARDYQRAVWAHLDDTTRERIRAARDAATDAA